MKVRDLFEVIERPVRMEPEQVYELVVARRNRGGIESRGKLRGKAIKVPQQFRVEADDFLLSNRQISHGGCGIVPAELSGAIVSGEYTVLHPKPILRLEYLRHLTHTRYFQQICFHSSVGVHVEKLVFRPDVWMDWQIDLPDLDEQRAIAGVLDECDRAIALMDSLVAAKRQALAHILQRLTSKGHLRRLTEIAEISFSGVDKKSVIGERPVQLCNYTDVYANARVVAGMALMSATATLAEIRKNELKAGDVLFTKDSETPEDIAASAFVPDNLPGVVCGYHLGIARPRTGLLDGSYLAFAMRNPRVLRQFRRAANGVVRFGLTLEAVERVVLHVPDLDRQRGIGRALTAMDEEIDLLASQATALRRQKRGLMQKLLTGHWRMTQSALGQAAE